MVHSRSGRGRGRRENQMGSSQPAGNMAAQNVNNSGQVGVPSLSQPIPSLGTASNNSSSDLCGTCNGITGTDAIGCDRCTNWFHPSAMCLGLPDQLITSIQEYGGTGIVFVCTECRTGSSDGGGVSQSALQQLFQTVKKLCETVQSLTSQVAVLSSGSGTASQPQSPGLALGLDPGPAPDRDQLRTLIREETREIEERHKCRHSIIVRGIKAISVDAFKPMFDSVCTYLTGSHVMFSNAVCISRERYIFRIKIEDDNSRKNLLDSARNLQNSSFSDTFINRDLTYKQRGELRARRTQRLTSGSNTPSQSSSAVRDSSPNSTVTPIAVRASGSGTTTPAVVPELNYVVGANTIETFKQGLHLSLGELLFAHTE
ncbi:hypothetical protein Pcinc_023315 [Petrolisthes cinctipes]|uniref:Uncharacterized protein n=1 Tax=Petrolisthes cinctipes TaxID=88211 RepID=A0AAE1FDQ9_PETCI|nr:hypothetical protein Pcinc_023315 [Petrolisthes cinctipes]